MSRVGSNSCRHMGQLACLDTQGKTHSVWYICLHGRRLVFSSSGKMPSVQIAHIPIAPSSSSSRSRSGLCAGNRDALSSVTCFVSLCASESRNVVTAVAVAAFASTATAAGADAEADADADSDAADAGVVVVVVVVVVIGVAIAVDAGTPGDKLLLPVALTCRSR